MHPSGPLTSVESIGDQQALARCRRSGALNDRHLGGAACHVAYLGVVERSEEFAPVGPLQAEHALQQHLDGGGAIVGSGRHEPEQCLHLHRERTMAGLGFDSREDVARRRTLRDGVALSGERCAERLHAVMKELAPGPAFRQRRESADVGVQRIAAKQALHVGCLVVQRSTNSPALRASSTSRTGRASPS